MSNPIRQAIDGSLSSLKVTDRDVGAIMDRIRQEEQPSARKVRLRYVVVLAVLLALLTAGGTAAVLLSPRELISDEVLPMAEESETGLWLTEEQVRKVLALARSNGIDMPRNNQERIDSALKEYGGYWTESLIYDLMYARYGSSVSDWPKEELQWVNRTVSTLYQDYVEGRDRAPQEGELQRDEAIRRAKELILQMRDAPLDDPTQYDISAVFLDGLSYTAYPGYFWRVDFCPKTVTAPMIEIEFSADGKQLYDFQFFPGAEGAQYGFEIDSAFRRIYGPMDRWPQEVLRAYVECLKIGEKSGMPLHEGYRYLLETEFPDVAPEAISMHDANGAALEALGLHVGGTVLINHTTYIGDEPNPIWKVVVNTERDVEGYSDDWYYLVEVDSVTGEVKTIDEVAGMHSFRFEYVPHSVYKNVTPDIPDVAYPQVTEEEARMKAVAAIQERFGETRDLNDETLFEITAVKDTSFQWVTRMQWIVTFDARAIGEVGYWAYIDCFGEIMDVGIDNGAISQGHSLDSIRLEYEMVGHIMHLTVFERFCEFKEAVARSVNPDDVIARLFLETTHLDPHEGERNKRCLEVEAFVMEEMGVKPLWLDDEPGVFREVVLMSSEKPGVAGLGLVWKFAMQTERGDFLVEVADVDGALAMLSVVEMKDPFDPWYATNLLQSDMEAAGIAPEPYAQPEQNGLAVDEGCVQGLPLMHIYARFRSLYGPDVLAWSQAQLQSFQRMASLSSSLAYDVGVACMQDTRYPQVPEGAISREEAAKAGAEALGLGEDTAVGAVLIADAPNAVWKVCYRTSDGWRYAEVDCMTGEVKTVAERMENGLWCQELVLERVLHEHEETFHSLSNG